MKLLTMTAFALAFLGTTHVNGFAKRKNNRQHSHFHHHQSRLDEGVELRSKSKRKGDADGREGEGREQKTPCEELLDKMEAARQDGDQQTFYGGTGCHDGEPLICVYTDAFIEAGDDPHGAAILSACISIHEHKHSEQAECDPNGTGVYPPNNDLKCDEAETEALGAEIECYDGQSCPQGPAGQDCRDLVEAFKTDACDQFEARKGKPHKAC